MRRVHVQIIVRDPPQSSPEDTARCYMACGVLSVCSGLSRMHSIVASQYRSRLFAKIVSIGIVQSPHM